MPDRGKEELLLLIGALRAHVEAEASAGRNTISFRIGGDGVMAIDKALLPASGEIFVAASPSAVPVETVPLRATGAPCPELMGAAEPERITTPLASPNVPLDLKALREELGDCRRCRLHLGRRNIVFGEGSPRAALAFVGEAPGADEDAQGRPFVGRAGQLLTRIIEAMKMKRSEVTSAISSNAGRRETAIPPSRRSPPANRFCSGNWRPSGPGRSAPWGL